MGKKQKQKKDPKKTNIERRYHNGRFVMAVNYDIERINHPLPSGKSLYF